MKTKISAVFQLCISVPLIKSTLVFSLENSDVCVSVRTGNGIGVSSGKIISHERHVGCLMLVRESPMISLPSVSLSVRLSVRSSLNFLKIES